MEIDELIEWGKNTANEATDCASVQLQTKEGDGKYLQGYCKAMMDFVSVIKANQPDLEADQKRLDWLMEQNLRVWYSPANKGWCDGSGKVFNSPREAIDKAMKESDNADTG